MLHLRWKHRPAAQMTFLQEMRFGGFKLWALDFGGWRVGGIQLAVGESVRQKLEDDLSKLNVGE